MDTLSLLERSLRSAPVPGVDSPDIPATLDLAREHGVAALLWDGLERASSGPAVALRAALEEDVQAAVVKEAFAQRELRRVLDALGAAGHEVLVLKGTALAYTVYREPWLRPRADTDLLVDAGAMAAVSSALRTLGYEQAQAISTGEFVSHQVAFERTDGHGLQHVIDLHWKAVNPQLLADALPFPVLWREAEAIATLGQHARVPCRLDAVLLACVHRMAHHQGQERLIWLYDLKLLTAPFGQDEWHAMCRIAADRRVAGLCLDGLERMSSRLGGRVPDAVAKALTRAATTEPSRRYLEGAVRRRDVLVSDLVLLPNWRARLKLVREHAFPPVPFIRQRYGIRNPFLLPALYLHRLATGAWKWLLQPR